MLLIDEAYALARGGDNDFGREAIDTLVKFMEDHRDDLAIVAAGYTEEMADFIDANPGLKSRFTRTISFPDYTDDELVAIFLALGEKSQYCCSDDALARVRHFVSAEPRTVDSATLDSCATSSKPRSRTRPSGSRHSAIPATNSSRR